MEKLPLTTQFGVEFGKKDAAVSYGEHHREPLPTGLLAVTLERLRMEEGTEGDNGAGDDEGEVQQRGGVSVHAMR